MTWLGIANSICVAIGIFCGISAYIDVAQLKKRVTAGEDAHKRNREALTGLEDRLFFLERFAMDAAERLEEHMAAGKEPVDYDRT